MPINPNTPRAVVEHMVREQVYANLHLPLPRSAEAPSGLVVNVSARHCHLSPQAVEQLFGPGYRLSPMKVATSAVRIWRARKNTGGYLGGAPRADNRPVSLRRNMAQRLSPPT